MTKNEEFLKNNNAGTLLFVISRIELGESMATIGAPDGVTLTIEEIRNYLNAENDIKKEKLAAMSLADLMDAIFEEGRIYGEMNALDYPDTRKTEFSVDDYHNEIANRVGL